MSKLKSLIFIMLALTVIIGASGCSAVQSVMPGGSRNFTSIEPTRADLAYATVSETQKLDLYIHI